MSFLYLSRTITSVIKLYFIKCKLFKLQKNVIRKSMITLLHYFPELIFDKFQFSLYYYQYSLETEPSHCLKILFYLALNYNFDLRTPKIVESVIMKFRCNPSAVLSVGHSIEHLSPYVFDSSLRITRVHIRTRSRVTRLVRANSKYKYVICRSKGACVTEHLPWARGPRSYPKEHRLKRRVL